MAADRHRETALRPVLREVVARIIRAAAPEQIVLFGSAARGEFRQGSDIDLLVVKRGARRRKVTGAIYQALIGVGHPVDVVVATPEDLARYRDSAATVIGPALREGKVVYAG